MDRQKDGLSIRYLKRVKYTLNSTNEYTLGRTPYINMHAYMLTSLPACIDRYT